MPKDLRGGCRCLTTAAELDRQIRGQWGVCGVLSVASGESAVVLCQRAQGCLLLPRLRARVEICSASSSYPSDCLFVRAWHVWITRLLETLERLRCSSRQPFSMSSNWNGILRRLGIFVNAEFVILF